MEALKRLTLALTVALVGAACGDDGDSTPSPGGSIDAGHGTVDGGVDASKGPTKILLPDGGPLPCNAATPAANGKCGGSSCEQTEAQLAASVKSGAKCGAPAEIAGFCSLSAVNTVTQCSYQYVSSLPSMLDQFASSTKTCSSAKFAMTDPTFSEGCIDCFVASSRCTAEKCLGECAVSTANDACDTCRITKGCIKQFYDCAGYADPLKPIEDAIGL
ncbi:MAG: hypothetical protein JWN48_960 [Myxococcaceae bacterium]|nr:hypothetical protein [Myxococcaceae bacterium]